jgi:hypothetical protein
MPYKDPEKRREGLRKWRAANREKAREANRKWRLANPDKSRRATRAYREANRERGSRTAAQVSRRDASEGQRRRRFRRTGHRRRDGPMSAVHDTENFRRPSTPSVSCASSTQCLRGPFAQA